MDYLLGTFDGAQQCHSIDVLFGLVPQPALRPVAKTFVAFLSQMPPRGPFSPVVPVFNYCTVNNLQFAPFLDTEEVAGSSPVVPTIFINNMAERP